MGQPFIATQKPERMPPSLPSAVAVPLETARSKTSGDTLAFSSAKKKTGRAPRGRSRAAVQIACLLVPTHFPSTR